MKNILLFTILACLVFTGCGKDNGNDGIDEPAPINYTATITSSATMNNGEKTDVVIAISPTPHDGDAISSVELFVNGKSHQTLFNLPYEFDYTPKDILPGTYKFNVVVKFQDGEQITAEKDVNIKVKLDTEFQGGVIISLDAAGLHGIIAAETDLDGGVLGKYRYGYSGGNYQSYSITDGYSNTQKFIGKSDDNYAAIGCLTYREGGFDDWYLPSIEEFQYWKNFERGANSALTPGVALGHLYWTSTLREDNRHAEVEYFGRASYILEDMEVGRFHYARCFRKF